MARVGRGAPGLRKGSQMEIDIQAMSDIAKQRRRKSMVSNVAENQKRQRQGKKPRTIPERDVDRLVTRHGTKKAKLLNLQRRIQKANAEAKRVGAASNKIAADTWRRVASEAQKRYNVIAREKK